MAQLPPRVPSMAPNWPPAFPPHNRMPPLTANSNPQPSWADEFLDFTSSRRGNHRRSASDSIAFLDPSDVDCARPAFERFDDDQLMSMFSDDLAAAASAVVPPFAGSNSSNPSSPSDQNSHDDDKHASPELTAAPKAEQGDPECSSDPNDDAPPNPNSDSVIDPKRVKRILANRQSAQRSRVRKLQYISELERSVTTLQTEVSALSPRVAFLDHQRLILNVDNSALKQRIAALAQDKIFKDAHQEALKKEIERLRQVYHHQSIKKMNTSNPTGAAPETAAAPSTSGNMAFPEKQLIAS